MKLNKNFAKPILKQDGTPDYAPAILKVVTHHHEDYEEPVIDPETEEPTGETEHKTRDYDTYETKMWPTAEDYHKMNYLDVIDEMPVDFETPDGKHYEARGWDIIEGVIRRVYQLVDNPPPAPRVFSKMKCVAALMEAGVWHEVKGYIEGAGLYDLYLAAQDFREDNPYFVSGKAQLMASLGWTEEQAEALLAKCVTGGV